MYPRSSTTTDSASAVTVTSAMSGQSRIMDPYTWACMFGAMAAGMNFFSGQPPRLPGGTGSQPQVQSSSQSTSSFWPVFPGFNFPVPRWPAP